MDRTKRFVVGRDLAGYKAFLRSIVTSALSFALDFFLCMLLVEKAGLGYLAVTTISFTSATCLNYFLSSRLIFGRGVQGRRNLEFLGFLAVAGLGLLLNAADMYFFTTVVGFHYLVSRVLSGSLVFFFNYWARRFIIFTQKDRSLLSSLKRAKLRLDSRGEEP